MCVFTTSVRNPNGKLRGKAMSTMHYHYHPSPVGPLLLAGEGGALGLLGFPTGAMARRHRLDWTEDAAPFAEVIRQLDQYFAGDRQVFDLDLCLSGTPFQEQVWRALGDIPYGETWSYGELARHIGRPHASRAVGAANGKNPIPLIFPCHRVIGSDGKPRGFGGGMEAQAFLLDVETAV
jgi:methylated-DNA-[protein]-cysteine S-methyltransferase